MDPDDCFLAVTYFFVQSGNVNAGSAYICSAPAGTITFGTTGIEFSQFSSSQVYTANTQAGLSLNGTVFNAKVDGITTAFDGGGNIVVKSSAQLTTPNIGAATGTSLSLVGTATVGNVDTGGYVSATGTITGGNLATGGTVSSTGTITGGNVNTGGNVSDTGNITGAYFFGNGSQLTGVTASQSGFPIVAGTSNIAGVTNGNISITVAGTPNVAVFTSGGEYITGLLSVTGTITGGNVETGGTVSATGTITGGNVNTGGNVSATGNVTGGNILTGGLISATGNITSGNSSTGIATIATATITTFANVTATTAATSNVTGALRVAGGVGVTGNVYADGMYVGGDSVLTTTSTVDGGSF